MMSIRLILKSIFFFHGTFLHELAHYVAALILGRAEGFSVWPKIQGGHFVFGSVNSRTRYKVLSSFIAFAPLIWWVVLLLILRYLRIIGTDAGPCSINFRLILKKVESLNLSKILFLWLFLQILWAGRPSLEDLKNFFKGLFSVSGIILIAVVAALIYITRYIITAP